MLSFNKYSKAIKLQLVVVCLFVFKNSFICQNLISNPSFEKVETFVDWNTGAFNNATVYPNLRNVTNWDWFNSPDYYSINVPYSGVFRGIPINDFGNAYPKHGNAYAGFIGFTKAGEWKEYVSQPLSLPLIQDSTYCLSFFVSRADRTTHSIKSIGAYFSVNTTTVVTTNNYINAIPQIVNTLGFITDTTSWNEIKGCYTALGGEKYITIGNFNSNINTDTLFVGSTNPHPYAAAYAYYYLDSVSLWKNNFPTSTEEFSKENSFSLYPNPTNGIVSINSKDDIRKIELTSVTGELLLQEFVDARKYQLQLRHFIKGLYIVKVYYTNGINISRKIIVCP